MNTSLVTCIIPVHNGELYLAQALSSIARQTYPAIEIVVVDDGSIDETRRIVEDFGHGVRYHYQSNAGPAAARNKGIALARGEYLAFLDADDVWLESKIDAQMGILLQDPAVDFCVCHLQNFWEPELAHEAGQYKEHRLSAPIATYTSVALCARRSAFERVGLYNVDLPHGMDIDWFLRARRAGSNAFMLPDVLVHRRLHPTNRSRLRGDSSRQTILRIVRESLKR